MLADNVKARMLASDGTYQKKQGDGNVNSQETFMEEAFAAEKESVETSLTWKEKLISYWKRRKK